MSAPHAVGNSGQLDATICGYIVSINASGCQPLLRLTATLTSGSGRLSADQAPSSSCVRPLRINSSPRLNSRSRPTGRWSATATVAG
jgi:hypothetical protein